MAETIEDSSHDMDMVPLFSETGALAEMEALAVQGILEANGIPFTVFGNSSLPVTEFSVNVPQSRLEEARRVLAEAQADGPAAAEEGERQSEAAGASPEV
jgi:hypothetical protein